MEGDHELLITKVLVNAITRTYNYEGEEYMTEEASTAWSGSMAFFPAPSV
jgi:hypothetical protein